MEQERRQPEDDEQPGLPEVNHTRKCRAFVCGAPHAVSVRQLHRGMLWSSQSSRNQVHIRQLCCSASSLSSALLAYLWSRGDAVML